MVLKKTRCLVISAPVTSGLACPTFETQIGIQFSLDGAQGAAGHLGIAVYTLSAEKCFDLKMG